MLARIMQAQDRGLSMVFCRTKRTCQKVADDLVDRGFAAGAVHGDLGQGQREQALRAFRSGKVDILVATDVAARGIDVEAVTHVINYQCPDEEKTYLHRIGRTGRAGASGVAVTFVDWDELHKWALINRALDLPFPDPPETYSTSTFLFEALDIPAGTKGTLPRAARTRAGLDAEVLEDVGETGGRGRGGTRSGGDRVRGAGDRAAGERAGRDWGPKGAHAPGPIADKPAGRPRARTRTRGAGAALSAVGTPAAQPDPRDPAAAGSSRRRRRGGRGRGGFPATAACERPAGGTDAGGADAGSADAGSAAATG